MSFSFSPRVFRRCFTTPNPLPATFIRGGTSKGVFINRAHLPPSPDEWGPILRGLIGSPDPFGRQLGGMGGGISSLSKVMVVGPSSCSEHTDVEYTFIQVGVKDGVIDTSGNCGNLTSAVGVFAIDEGIIPPPPPSPGVVNLWNHNTRKIIRTTFPVSEADGRSILDRPDISIAGVAGTGSRIELEFFDPAGAKTGRLLPTGKPRDVVKIKTTGGKSQMVKISCVDVTNPTIFIMLSKLNALLQCRGIEPVPSATADAFVACEFQPAVLELLEEIRQAAAVMMGMDPAVQGQPKISVLRPSELADSDHDFAAKTLSMGALHKAIPSTVALCLGAAAGVKGSIVNQAMTCIIQRGKTTSRDSGEPDEATRCVGDEARVQIKIPGGFVGVVGRFENGNVKSVVMERTARRLMRGEVFW